MNYYTVKLGQDYSELQKDQAYVVLTKTVAELYPTEIETNIELATAVIIGLFLLSVVFLPIFIPSLISLEDFFQNKKIIIKNKVFHRANS